MLKWNHAALKSSTFYLFTNHAAWYKLRLVFLPCQLSFNVMLYIYANLLQIYAYAFWALIHCTGCSWDTASSRSNFLHFCNVQCNVYYALCIFRQLICYCVHYWHMFWDFFLSANVLVFVHPFCTGCLLLLCFVRLWLIHERFSHLGAADCGDNFVFPSPLFSCLIRLWVFRAGFKA